MKYQIRFTQGEIAGKCFPLTEDKALTIGRSHSNELKLSAPDVSGRHVVLMLSDGGVAMDNLSSRVTLVDSAPLAAAERKTLMAGQTVTMGSSTAFVLECLPDAAPAAPQPAPSNDDEQTALPAKPAVAPPPPKPSAPASSDDDATNLNIKPVAPKPAAPKPSAVASSDDDATNLNIKPAAPKPAAPADNDMTIIPAKPAAAPQPAARKPVLNNCTPTIMARMPR